MSRPADILLRIAGQRRVRVAEAPQDVARARNLPEGAPRTRSGNAASSD